MHIRYTHATSAEKIAAFPSGGETGTLPYPSHHGSSELKLHKSCVSASVWGTQSCLYEPVLQFVLKWFKHRPCPGCKGNKVWSSCWLKQAKPMDALAPFLGRGCCLPPPGVGAGIAKTHGRTQNISNYLAQLFILAEICLSRKGKPSERCLRRNSWSKGWMLPRWAFSFVFSLGIPAVTSCPELAMMPSTGWWFGSAHPQLMNGPRVATTNTNWYLNSWTMGSSPGWLPWVWWAVIPTLCTERITGTECASLEVLLITY